MQVDPIEPVLKAPGSMLLNLRYDGLLSDVAFRFNLRRYNQGGRENVEEAFAYVVQEYLTDITASGRGLHSFTSRLNLSAFHGIGVRVGVV